MRKITVFLAKVIAGLFMLGVAYVCLVFYLKYSECVVLPNGYTISYYSVFDHLIQKEPTLRMMLKDESGKIMYKGDGFINLRRHPNNPDLVRFYYGSTLSEKYVEIPGHHVMDLIWDRYSRGRYQRTWNQPNRDFPQDLDIFATNLYYIYETLRRDEKFLRLRCGTPWVSLEG